MQNADTNPNTGRQNIQSVLAVRNKSTNFAQVTSLFRSSAKDLDLDEYEHLSDYRYRQEFMVNLNADPWDLDPKYGTE
jgi:hypothetical protein